MNPTNALGVITGEKPLVIGFETRDMIQLSVGVFVAMLLALLIVKKL